MPRDIPVSNGNLLVAFDKNYNLRELNYPYVGMESHTEGEAFRLGFWVDGKFSWVGDGWDIERRYMDETMVTNVCLLNGELGIRVFANDLVDFRENIYLKRMTVENLTDTGRQVRVFFHHDFHIYDTEVGDTANYQPDTGALYHFKEKRCFYVNVKASGTQGFDQFATGNKELPRWEGTWRDAEDGVLGRNPIAQGAVDSVGAVWLTLEPRSSKSFYYWICAGQDWHEVSNLNTYVMEHGPETIFRRTADYWRLWVNKEALNYDLLPERVAWLYKMSLLIMRTQIDNRGGILAANDSDSLSFNRDTYSYVWPRDGALAAYGLDLAGYPDTTRMFYEFCARVLHGEGYFLHKYTASGAEGSSWHPWYDVEEDKPQLPIQEDEVALVLWALWHHFDTYRDIEFIRPLYDTLIRNAGDFMLNYRDPRTGLPLPSYDLWEERRGVVTCTAGTVFGGLKAAARFAAAFGEHDRASAYDTAADGIRAAMAEHLYLQDKQRFCRLVNFRKDGSREVDDSLDASIYAVCVFGAFAPDDGRVVSTMEQIYDRLWIKAGIGGLARYEGDLYHRSGRDIPGNPWIITTMWLARYYVVRAKNKEDLEKAMELLQWVVDRALPSGVLAEQVNPFTNAPLSVSPLTWSHASFVAVVQEYLNKRVELERCAACGHPGLSKYRAKPAERVPSGV
ncbi:MAG: glycoside hydrolase family 15 protein [Endomicrobiales bacterium]